MTDRATADGEAAVDRRSGGRITGLLLALILAVYLKHALHYRGLIDDAFISFRFARNLAEGHGLVFNLGERVEGYTNLLWVLMLATATRLGLDPVVWSQVLGLAAGLGTLLVVYRAGARETSPLVALVAPAFLAANRTFCAWSTGGLETSLFTFLCVLGVSRIGVGTPGALGTAGLTLGLAALTRPEGLLVAGGAAFSLAGPAWREPQPSTRRRVFIPWKDILRVLGPVALLAGAQLVFRLFYYGRWAPNTAAVKIPGIYLASGLLHVALFLRDNLLGPEAVALTLAAWAAWAPRRPRGALAVTRCGLLTSAVYLVYIALIGGDVFEYRFFHPILGLLAVPVAAGVAHAAQLLRGTARRTLPLAAAATLATLVVVRGLVVSYAGFEVVDRPVAFGSQRGHVSIVSVEFEQAFAQPFARLGQWLHAHADPGETIALRAIGAAGYYSGLRVIDVHGLIEPDLSRLSVHGRDVVGHERRADVPYLLERGMTYYFAGRSSITLPGPDPNRFVRVHLPDGQVLVFQSVDPRARIQPGEYSGE